MWRFHLKIHIISFSQKMKTVYSGLNSQMPRVEALNGARGAPHFTLIISLFFSGI